MNKVINFAPAAFYVISGICFLCITMTNKKAKENEVKLAEMEKVN